MTERNLIERWMRSVMEEKEWSAERWATLAGTSPTNITRFLGGKADFIPSTKTLAKLARIAGSSPQIGRATVKTPAEVQVSLYNWSELGEILTHGEIEKRRDRVVSTISSVSEKAYAVIVEVETLAIHGIMKGDTVIIEPKPIRDPKIGDFVVFLDDEGLPSIGQFYETIVIGGRKRYETRNIAIGGVVVEVRRTF